MVFTTERWAAYRVPDSLPDDTEESIVGTEWHQEASGDAAGKFREGARRHGATWGVCEQIALVGLRRLDGRPFDPRPDVMVLPQPLPSGAVSSIARTAAGAPLLIIEVASRSTVSADVGEKRNAYEAIGVVEYLVFDPHGTLLATPLSAWRLEGDAYVPWLPAEDGWWYSTALGVSLQPVRHFLSMRDRDGREIPATRTVHILVEEKERLLVAKERLLVEERRRYEEERRLRLAIEEELRRLREG